MDNISELEQFYDTIEKTKNYIIDLPETEYNKTLKKIKDNAKSSDISKKAQTELKCFKCIIKDGKAQPKYRINEFDEEDYNYIKKRIDNTTNSILKFRYATIIWTGKRDYEYGKLAIDESLEIINKLKSEMNDSALRSLTKYIINTYVISKKINYRNPEIKSIILNLIKDPKLNKTEYLKYDLVEFTIEQRKNFKEDFKDIDSSIWTFAEYLKNKDQKFLLRLIELRENINGDKNKWIKLKIETCEKLAEKENNFLRLYYLSIALSENKKLKNKAKEKELSEKYDKAKETIEFPEVSFEIPVPPEIFSIPMKKAKEVSEKDSESILNHLINDKDFLVGNYENLTTNLESFPLLSEATILLFDERKHKRKEYRTEKGTSELLLDKDYNLYIHCVTIPYLNHLIYYSFINKKISPDIIMQFIKEKTWLCKKSKQNKDTRFNHISYLLLIIKQYFQEYPFYLNHPDYSPQFVLTMDSLILKIEGVIRDLCKLEESTLNVKNDSTNEEKSLNKLLEGENLEKRMGKDDLFFLKFVLIDQGGLNLRNKIAHSLMNPSEYNIDNMNILLLALFRLLKIES